MRKVSLSPLLITHIVSALLSASVGAQPKKNSTGADVNAERLAAMRLKMQSFVERGSVAGVVTLIAQHGRVLSPFARVSARN